jgi:hypothetical protein
MALFKQKVRQWVLACGAAALLVLPATGVELRSETAVAFDHYIHATEERMANDLSDGHFLIIDRLPRRSPEASIPAVYIEVESVGLSRTIPWEISWLVTPLIRSILKSVLSDLLDKTRIAVRSTAQSQPTF